MNAQQSKFEVQLIILQLPYLPTFVVRLHELATHISFFQNAIVSIPRSHPLRAPGVQALATALLGRYSMSNDTNDLEQSIPHFTEAILLPLPWDRRCLNIIQIFFYITLFLVHRANESRQPEVIMRSIIHLHYLRRQSLEALNVPPDSVTVYLVTLLGIKVEMKLGDARHDIEEMAILCHELLKSDISTTSLTGSIMDLVRSVVTIVNLEC